MFERLFGPRRQKPARQVKIDVVHAVELKSDSTYILVADSKHVTKADLLEIKRDMKRAGVKNVIGFLLGGDPDEAVQFVERNNPKKRKR